jgi:hypothetical protein
MSFGTKKQRINALFQHPLLDDVEIKLILVISSMNELKNTKTSNSNIKILTDKTRLKRLNKKVVTTLLI